MRFHTFFRRGLPFLIIAALIGLIAFWIVRNAWKDRVFIDVYIADRRVDSSRSELFGESDQKASRVVERVLRDQRSDPLTIRFEIKRTYDDYMLVVVQIYVIEYENGVGRFYEQHMTGARTLESEAIFDSYDAFVLSSKQFIIRKVDEFEMAIESTGR